MLFLFLLPLITRAEGNFRYLGVDQGLGSRKVYQIEKDSSGFLWMFTQAGMERYDGSSFRRYSLSGNSSLNENNSSGADLTVDEEGVVWISLPSGQVYRYNSEMDRFDIVFSLFQDSRSSVKCILPFNQSDVMVATSEGLFRWSGATVTQVGLEGVNMNHIVRSSDGMLWLSTDEGVWHCSSTGDDLMKVQSIGDLPVLEVFDCGEKLFLGTFNMGVWVWDKNSYELRRLSSLPTIAVRVICASSDGNILVGMDGAGVFIIDPVSLSIVGRYIPADDIPGSLLDNTVTDITVDGDDYVWVATSTRGVSYLVPDMYSPLWMTHAPSGDNSIDDDNVNVIYQDRDGDFWFGTNRGVNLLHDGQWRHFLSSAEGNVVLSIAQDRDGLIWVGGYGIGLHLIDKETGKVQNKPSPLQYIYHIYPDGGNMWLGGLEGDFSRYSMSEGSWTGYPATCVGDIWAYGKDTLLLAGCQGLGVFDRKTSTLQWKNSFGDFSITSPVRALFLASDSTLWMATDGDGLIQYDLSTGSAGRYTMENGLPGNNVLGVHEDNVGMIWFITPEGLFWLDPEQRTIISADGLLEFNSGIFNPNSIWKGRDGALMFGTSQGVLSFDPSKLEYFSEPTLNIVLTDLSINYETVTPGEKGGVLPRSLDNAESLTLGYDSNSFSIAHSCINYKSDFRIRFEYSLQGYDSRWLETGSSGTATYVKVRPGRYVFTIRAIDKYSSAVISSRSLPVRIRQPWWFSIWAFLFYTVFLGLALLSSYLYFTRRRKERNILQRIQTFISVAHDLKTPVSLIKSPLGELEGMEDIPPEGRKRIMTAMRNTDKLMDMINKLLDLRRNTGSGESLQVENTAIYDYLSSKIGEYRIAADRKGLELSLDVEKGLTVPVDRAKMDTVLDNLLSNAIKYTSKGSVDVLARSSEASTWILEVRDTGIGLPSDADKYLFQERYRAQNAQQLDDTGYGIGLLMTGAVVRQHHGNISYRSSEGQGTVFTVTLPLHYRSSEYVAQADEESLTYTADPTEPVGERNTLLIIEDEDDMRNYLEEAFSGEYRVLTAPGAAKGLELAREMNPDIIVSDLVMPVMRGDELCRILKSSVETSHIPFVLLTGLSDRASIIFGLEAGANDYILKPFDLNVLKARLRNILQERQRLRESFVSPTDGDPEPDYGNRLDQEFMDKVMASIREHLSDPSFSIAVFCQDLAMSRTAVFNKLKTLTGQGPNDFIRIVRLNKAMELLRSKEHNIAEVSDMVGFSDPKYFSVCFKKQFGQSPSKIQ